MIFVLNNIRLKKPQLFSQTTENSFCQTLEWRLNAAWTLRCWEMERQRPGLTIGPRHNVLRKPIDYRFLPGNPGLAFQFPFKRCPHALAASMLRKSGMFLENERWPYRRWGVATQRRPGTLALVPAVTCLFVTLTGVLWDWGKQSAG